MRRDIHHPRALDMGRIVGLWERLRNGLGACVLHGPLTTTRASEHGHGALRTQRQPARSAGESSGTIPFRNDHAAASASTDPRTVAPTAVEALTRSASLEPTTNLRSGASRLWNGILPRLHQCGI